MVCTVHIGAVKNKSRKKIQTLKTSLRKNSSWFHYSFSYFFAGSAFCFRYFPDVNGEGRRSLKHIHDKTLFCIFFFFFRLLGVSKMDVIVTTSVYKGDQFLSFKSGFYTHEAWYCNSMRNLVRSVEGVGTFQDLST